MRILVLISIFTLLTNPLHADDIWETVFRKARETLMQLKQEEGLALAKEAWTLARKEFGDEDTRTYASEYLVLTAASFSHDPAVAQAALTPEEAASFIEVYRKSVTHTEETLAMTWRYGEPSPEFPQAKHIIFHFVEYPNHYIGIYSTQLPAYLDALTVPQVPVTFELTHSALGEFIGYMQKRIGNLTQWDSLPGGYGGYRDEFDPAPFGQVQMK